MTDTYDSQPIRYSALSADAKPARGGCCPDRHQHVGCGDNSVHGDSEDLDIGRILKQKISDAMSLSLPLGCRITVFNVVSHMSDSKK
jgi:hypothetical protein